MDFMGVFLDKQHPKPLYIQLYEYLAAEIRQGRIEAGEKLPGKRTAAAQLGVSVNTVDGAYQMLAGEGYVQARARSGFAVSQLGQLVPPPIDLPRPTVTAPEAAQQAEPRHFRYSFLSDGIDTRLFPRKTWNRLSKEVLAGPEDLFARGEPLGDAVLREAVASYLRGYRGVRCGAEQVVVGAGLEVLLERLSPLLPRGPVALENPGYPKTARIFQNVRRATVPLDVDEQGMPPKLLQLSQAGSAYLTPSHQFPTGCVMPAPRRLALLRWAAKTGGVLIEDDYDSEFRFDGRPLPSLQGMDEHSRVVYAGTFSRSLAPGIRAAYLVLPKGLLAAWREAYGTYACTIWRPEQHTLARFMEGGHFARRLNRMRAAYRLRRDEAVAPIKEHLPEGSYEILGAHTGLYFVLRLPGQNAAKIAGAAAGQGLHIVPLSTFALPGTGGFSLWGGGKDAFILGYGGLPENETTQAVTALLPLLKENIQ